MAWHSRAHQAVAEEARPPVRVGAPPRAHGAALLRCPLARPASPDSQDVLQTPHDAFARTHIVNFKQSLKTISGIRSRGRGLLG